MSLNVNPILIPIGNQRIFGTFHAPKIKQGAAVLFLHGFNSTKSDRFRFSYELAQELSDVGIASLRIDVRGCGESDGHFKEMSVTSQVDDAIAGLKWLQKEYGKIGILGRSLGAAVALKAAVRCKVQTLALFSPVFDGYQWQKTPKIEGHYEIGGASPGDQFLHEMSQMSVEKEFKELSDTPIFHVHADQDEILSSDHRESFIKFSSPHHRYLILKNADHTYSKSESRKILGMETKEWFIKTLL